MTEATAGVERFLSLEELKAKYDDLLKRGVIEKGGTADPHLLDELVPEFIRQACATGTVLEDDAERYAAQGMITYWTSALYRARKVPPDDTLLAPFDEAYAPELPDDRCPYVAPSGFRDGSPQQLFGWGRLMRECLARLADGGVVAVVGPPGSGRLSLLTEGVLPALQKGELPGSAEWRVLPVVRLGTDPLVELARAVSPGAAESVAMALRKDAGQLAGLLDAGGGTAVLVIHALEEVLVSGNYAQARPFLENLLAVVQGGRHRVMLTMRAESFGQLAGAEQLLPLLERARVYLTFTTRELRQAVEEPAKKVGLRFDGGLVDRLLQDVQGEPAAASLLQFLLLHLWQTRKGNRITAQAYEDLGYGRLALGRVAERVYQDLAKDGFAADAQHVWAVLERPSLDGTPRTQGVRLEAMGLTPEQRPRAAEVLKRFAAAWLVSHVPGVTPELDQFMPAFGALSAVWPRLAEWQADERYQRRRWLRLRSAAEQWQAGKEAISLLWGGAVLEEAEGYPDLDELQRRFLAASRWRQRLLWYVTWGPAIVALIAAISAGWWILELRRSQAQATADRATENANRETEAAKREAENASLREISLSFAAIESGQNLADEGDLSGAVLWYGESLRLLEGTKERKADVLGKETRRNLEENYRVRLALAGRDLPELRHVLHHKGLAAAAFSPDDRWAATTSQTEGIGANTFRLWDIGAGTQTPFDHGVPVTAVRFPPQKGEQKDDVESTYVVAAGGKPDDFGRVTVWKLDTMSKVDELNLGTAGTVTQLEFAPNGKSLLLVLKCRVGEKLVGQVIVCDYEDGQVSNETALPVVDGLVNWAAFQPNTERVFAAVQYRNDTGEVCAWDRSCKEIGWMKQSPDSRAVSQRPAHPDRAPILHLCFSGDGSHFITSGGQEQGLKGEALLWSDLKGDQPPRKVTTYVHRGQVVRAAFRPSRPGNVPQVLTCGRDGDACLWDYMADKPIRRLAHGADVVWGEFSPDEQYVVTGCRDRTARIWDLQTGALAFPAFSHGGTVDQVWFSGNGATLFTLTSRSESVQGWDLLGTRHSTRGIHPGGEIRHGDYQPARKELLTLSFWPGDPNGRTPARAEAVIWDANTGRPVSLPLATNPAAGFVALSPAGNRVAIIAGASTQLWSIDRREGRLANVRLVSVLDHGRQVNHVGFSREGDRLVTATGVEGTKGGRVRVWDAGDGRLLLEPLRHDYAVRFAAFSPDGERIVAVGGDGQQEPTVGEARVWDSRTGKPIGRLGDGDPKRSHKEPVVFAAFSRKGRVVTTSKDNRACLWDPESGETLFLGGEGAAQGARHTADVIHASFSSDDTQVVTASKEGTAIVWGTQDGEWNCTLEHPSGLRTVSFAPKGRYVVTAGDDGVVRLWDAQPQFQIRSAGEEEPNLVQPPRLLGSVRLLGPILHAGCTPDGDTLEAVSRINIEPNRGNQFQVHSFGVQIATWPITSDQGAAERVVRRGRATSARSLDEKARALQVLPGDKLAQSRTGRDTLAPGPEEQRADYHEREARLANSANKVASAEWHLNRALEHVAGQNRALASLYAFRAKIREEGNPFEAIQDYKSAIEIGERLKDPDGDGIPYVGLARTLLATGRVREANLAYQEAVNRLPDDSLLWLGLAETHVLLGGPTGEGPAGHRKKALAAFDKAIRLGEQMKSKDRHPWVRRSVLLETMKMYELVVQDCTKAIDLQPNSPDNWELLGRRARALHQLGEEHERQAMEDFLNAGALCPMKNVAIGLYFSAERLVSKLDPGRTPELRRKMGLLYADIGRYDDAVKYLEPLKDPDGEVHRRLAQVYSFRREFEKADRRYLRAITEAQAGEKAVLQRDRVNNLLNKARAHRAPNVKEWGLAEKAYSEVLRQEHDVWRRVSILLDRAAVYEAVRMWNAALADYDAAMQLNPKYTWLYESKARVYGSAGRWAEAAAEYDKALKLNPTAGWLALQLARARAEEALQLADPPAEERKWKEVDTALAEAIRLSPQDINPLTRLAALQLWRGDQAAYRQTCADLVERFPDPTSAQTANSIAWILTLGNERPAVELSQRAVKAASAHPARTRATYTNTLAAAHYRAGEYVQALERLTESIKLHEKDQAERKVTPVEDGKVDDWLLLALTYHALENPEKAREWLVKATKWLEERKKNRDHADQTWTVWGRIDAEILHREAKRLIDPEKR